MYLNKEIQKINFNQDSCEKLEELLSYYFPNSPYKIEQVGGDFYVKMDYSFVGEKMPWFEFVIQHLIPKMKLPKHRIFVYIFDLDIVIRLYTIYCINNGKDF